MAMIKFKRGFTLIELAIALAVSALLLGGLSVPLSKRITEQQYTQTQENIDRAMEALVGFALLNQRLPCPDISTSTTDNRDGLEDATTSVLVCAVGANTGSFDFTLASDASGASWGDLPWKTLGLSAPFNSDAWNNRLRYAVVTNFAMPASTLPLKTNLGAAGAANTLDIYCRSPGSSSTAAPGCLASTVPAYIVSQDVAFVIYSSGANGWGTTGLADLAIRTPFTATQLTFAPDEAVNAPEKKSGSTAAAITSRKQFLTRDRTDSTSTAGEFDDLLSFMPRAKLIARLMNAGLYP
jgi:prepilin-type N-terminal cleavage/methylation domain-containing protein